MDRQTVVKDVKQFMHRENAQRREKYVKNARTKNNFASQCLWKNVNFVESDQGTEPILKDELLSAKSRKMTTSNNGKHPFELTTTQ